jgi:hypothetical protein
MAIVSSNIAKLDVPRRRGRAMNKTAVLAACAFVLLTFSGAVIAAEQ